MHTLLEDIRYGVRTLPAHSGGVKMYRLDIAARPMVYWPHAELAYLGRVALRMKSGTDLSP